MRLKIQNVCHSSCSRITQLTDCLWRFAVFWTLRSLVGPLLETLITLDRVVGLAETLGDRKTVESRLRLINLFGKDSSRAFAIVVD